MGALLAWKDPGTQFARIVPQWSTYFVAFTRKSLHEFTNPNSGSVVQSPTAQRINRRCNRIPVCGVIFLVPVGYRLFAAKKRNIVPVSDLHGVVTVGQSANSGVLTLFPFASVVVVTALHGRNVPPKAPF